MDLNTLKIAGFCGFASMVLASCSSNDSAGATTSWLGPLHNYERVGGENDNGVFVLKGSKPVAAERILLAPTEITISANSDLNSITPSAYERIRRNFADVLAREFSKQPNKASDVSGAYVVRITLTNLTAKRIGKDVGTNPLADLRFSFESAAIEVELRNQQTNTRNAVVVLPARAKTVTASGLPQTLTNFAQRVWVRISEARAELSRRAATPATLAPTEKK